MQHHFERPENFLRWHEDSHFPLWFHSTGLAVCMEWSLLRLAMSGWKEEECSIKLHQVNDADDANDASLSIIKESSMIQQASIVPRGLSRCSFSLGAENSLKPQFSERNKMFFEQAQRHLSRTYMTWYSLPNIGWKRIQSFLSKLWKIMPHSGYNYSEFPDSQLGWMWTSRWTPNVHIMS